MKEKQSSVSLGTLYNFNKTIMSQYEKIDPNKLEKMKIKLENWFNWHLDGYAMLLCRERYDFTIFHLYEKQNQNPPNIAVRELIEVLNNRGTILSIEEDINNQWEIWVKIDDEPFAYYLFNCDDWVIEC